MKSGYLFTLFPSFCFTPTCLLPLAGSPLSLYGYFPSGVRTCSSSGFLATVVRALSYRSLWETQLTPLTSHIPLPTTVKTPFIKIILSPALSMLLIPVDIWQRWKN